MANATDPKASETPINFTINVSANEVDPEKDEFKCKVVIDFAPPFGGGNGSLPFNANTIHGILDFISDRVLKKVVEAVYYDREVATYDKKEKTYNAAKDLVLPDNYGQAMAIYDERSSKKNGKDNSHLDIKERKSKKQDSYRGKDDDEDCIECIVNKFFNNKDRQIWSKEKNVTRITFEQMSPPSLTVETKTTVNGDKRPK
jgi:hypothetical protein